MSKIDIDKFVVSLYNEIHNIRPEYIGAVCKNILDMCINKQGIFYKDGDIVEIYPKLSNLEQNGKNSKPANFAKSSKDLQELTETNRILAEDLLLTDFGKEVEDMVLYISKHPNGLIGGVKGYSFRKIPSLYSLAVKQFKQDQMNQEFATFTRQEFNDAVNEEIKRRCEGIDVDEMFDKVPPRIFKTDFDFYKKGVVDTINKLKGE